MKDTFLKIYNENIKRPGADKLLAWLEKSDFFTAPASTRYHLSRPGGLCEHSVNVYNRLIKLTDGMKVTTPAGTDLSETYAICALLHDICKVNVYKPDTRNVKNDQGVWEKVPCYTYDDKLPYGHGEKSVYIVSGFLRLTRDEAMAIRWHMGEDATSAFRTYPLSLMLHMADMQATFLDEEES